MTNNYLLWIKHHKEYEIHLRKVKDGFRLIIYHVATLTRYKITLDPVNYHGKEESVAWEFIDSLNV